MRRLWIFLYFLILTTMSLHVGNIIAFIITVSLFMGFYNLAEQLDLEDQTSS
jgi:hypothetical protein